MHNIVPDVECDVNLTSFMLERVHLPDDQIQNELYELCSYKNLYHVLHRDYPKYMWTADTLKIYVPPVLLILGTFGNLFSFVILARSMFKISTYSYLAVLALMDLLVLYIGLLRMWIGHLTEDIQEKSDFLCKLVSFLGYVTSDSSVWLIIAVTVERFIAVCFPLRAQRMCNVRCARLVILGVVLAMCAVNAHFIWTVELRISTNNGSFISECKPTKVHTFLVKDVWPWVDAAIYSFVPFIIITVLNISIIRHVLHARKRRNALQQLPCSRKFNGAKLKAPTKPHGESNKKLTFMLLSVSFTFLLTTLPMNLLQIVFAFSVPKEEDIGTPEHAKRFAVFYLVRTIVELLMYVNHSINFFLYCATGRKFRRQFRIIVCMCCRGEFRQTSIQMRNRNTTNSFRLSRLNSLSSPKSMIVEYDLYHSPH